MLDIERGEHVDPGVAQFLDILLALGVSVAGGIAVRKLGDQRYGRAGAAIASCKSFEPGARLFAAELAAS